MLRIVNCPIKRQIAGIYGFHTSSIALKKSVVKELKDQVKRPANAFALFLKDKIDDYRKPGVKLNISDVTKSIGSEWKELSESAKKAYTDQYEKAKALYLESNPKPPKKRAPTAYMIYFQERFKDVESEVKTGEKLAKGQFEEITGKIGSEWKQLSDSAKSKYQDLAATAKEEFEKANPKEPKKPKGPPSAYTLFLKERYEEVKGKGNLTFAEISKEIGNAWKKLPDSQKQTYKDSAEKLKNEWKASH